MNLIVLLKPHAYLDPGSGSLILQVILASLLAIGFTLKVFWKKIVSFVNRILGKEQAPIDEN
jgi:hypothetical protein